LISESDILKETESQKKAIHFTPNQLDNALKHQCIEETQNNETGKRFLICEGEDIS